MSWAERAADRSPSVQRSRTRSMAQARQIVDAARRLIDERGEQFTTQELAKEAGVALQTFYRYFSGKDQLILAVMEDILTEGAEAFLLGSKDLPDPVSRLHLFVTNSVSALSNPRGSTPSRFVTSQHLRLHQIFPEDMARITRPITEMVATQLRNAQELGQLKPTNVDQSAFFLTQLVMGVYHHYAFAQSSIGLDEIGEQLWSFCLVGIGGTVD